MMSRVVVRDLRVYGFHGCLPQERERGQDFLVDLEIEYDSTRAAQEDNLSFALDYDRVVNEIHAIVATERYDLLETLVNRIGNYLLDWEGVSRVWVRVKKSEAPLIHPVSWVGVESTFSREKR